MVYVLLTWHLDPGTVLRLNQLRNNYKPSVQGVPRTFVSGARHKTRSSVSVLYICEMYSAGWELGAGNQTINK